MSLRNSNFTQFDYDFASQLKEDEPEVWGAGGNIRATRPSTFGRAPDKATTPSRSCLGFVNAKRGPLVISATGSQFPEDSPNLSNIGGVVAAIKWGVILDIGEATMKDAVREVIDKQNRNHDHIMERRFFTTSIEARSDSPRNPRRSKD